MCNASRRCIGSDRCVSGNRYVGDGPFRLKPTCEFGSAKRCLLLHLQAWPLRRGGGTAGGCKSGVQTEADAGIKNDNSTRILDFLRLPTLRRANAPSTGRVGRPGREGRARVIRLISQPAGIMLPATPSTCSITALWPGFVRQRLRAAWDGG